MEHQKNFDSSVSEFTTEGDWLYPKVSEFYRGKTIAITGGTGSLGQALIEKLLRCCPDVKKIIVFVREKRGVEPSERMKTFGQAEVFDALRKTNPDFMCKIDYVCCDLYAADLGLNEDDKLILLSEVDIFIHSAANMRFNEKLRNAYAINVQCVRRLLKFCKGMAKLKALLHVSTAYSHCDRKLIEEKFYDCSVDYLEVESIIKCLDDEALEKITPNLLGKRPNVYTLTKAMGEEVIARESNDLPVCVVRPSMIVPAWKDPMPGWCSSLHGPTAFFIAYAKGILKSAIADENVIGDVIPIDLVVNGIIAAAMKTACDFTDCPRQLRHDLEKGEDIGLSFTEDGLLDGEGAPGTLVNIRKNIPIYHFTTGHRNPLYIRDMIKFGREWYNEYPLDPHRLPGVFITRNRYIHKINTFLQQTVPAYIEDMILLLMNKERKMKSINDRIVNGLTQMEFFFTRQWEWDCTNANSLRSALCPQDQEIFDFDPNCITWKEHSKKYVIGTRQFLTKQNMNSYPEARKALERLRLQNYIFNSVAALGILVAATSCGLIQHASYILSNMF